MNEKNLENTKRNLRAILLSSRSELTIQNLNLEYYKELKCYIPYNILGYSSLEIFLNSLDDTVIINGTGLNALVTCIVPKNARNFKRPHSRNNNNGYSSPSNIYNMINQNLNNNKKCKPGPIPQCRVSATYQYQNVTPQTPPPHQQHRKIKQYSSDSESIMSSPCRSYSRQLDPIHYEHFPIDQYSLGTNDSIRSSPTGNIYPRKSEDFFELHQIDLNTNDSSNSKSPLKYLTHKDPRVSKVQIDMQPLINDLSLSLSKKKSKQFESSTFNNNNNQNHLPFALNGSTNNLRSGTSPISYAQPIHNTEEDDYNIPSTSHNDFQTLSPSKSSVNQQQIYEHTNLRLNKNTVPSIQEDDYNMPSQSNSNDDLDDDILSKWSGIFLNKIEEVEVDPFTALPYLEDNDIIFANNKKKYGKKIEPLVFPEFVKINALFEICINEINNPNRFWFNFRSERANLDDLMNDIENHYTNISYEALKIKEDDIKKGQICAAIFCNMWHRGEIVSDSIIKDKVRVYFLDYGTTSKVEKGLIKYLLPEFCQLPRQAVRGSLFGLKPIHHRWTRNSTYTMLTMVSDLTLYCKVIEITESDQIINMILYDTTREDEEIIINDSLIDEGHGLAFTENDVDVNNILRRKQFAEVFPPFRLLESGDYPSFEAIGILLTKGIDFEHEQDEELIPNVDILKISGAAPIIKKRKGNDGNPFYRMDNNNNDDDEDDDGEIDDDADGIIQEYREIKAKLKEMHLETNYIKYNYLFTKKEAENPFM